MNKLLEEKRYLEKVLKDGVKREFDPAKLPANFFN